jgi:hypothetical protein
MITLPQIKQYIDNLAKLQASGQPYTIDYTDSIVQTPSQNYRIFIPDVIINDITLEEL